MAQFQALEINDFSGGITDEPFDAPPNMSSVLDNITLDSNKRPMTRPGSDPYITGVPELPTTLRPHAVASIQDNSLFVASRQHVYYPGVSSWSELLGISSVPAFNAFSNTMYSAFAEWNQHLFAVTSEFSTPIKIFLDGSNVPTLRTAGLPKMTTFTATPTTGGTGNSWIYYVVYRYNYTSQLVQFSDFSSPFAVQVNSSSSTVACTLSAIPVLANAGGTSYDTANIVKEIYRTVNGGQIAYLVATIPNATTSYVDSSTDAAILNNATLYTTLGTKAYDPPPLAKYIHIMNGRAYYAYIKDGSSQYPNRVFQSIQDDPDSVPAGFFTDLRDEIRGISSFNNNVIVFGKTKIYRIDGYFDEKGRNGMIYEEISKVTGCVSHTSIVQTDIGVFFAGTAGFYWTDGFSVEKVSDSINTRYLSLIDDPVDLPKIQGCYDAVNMKVNWAVSQTGVQENDSLYVLDLRWGKKRQSCFTTWTNDTYFRPSAIGMFKNRLIRADSRGYVFVHDPQYSSDPRIAVGTSYTNWDRATIIYDITTRNLDFGFPQVRKWVPRVLVTAKNLSNLSLQINSINDNSETVQPLREIRFRDIFTWGEPTVTWGDASLIWGDKGLIEQYRKFPAGTLRCSSKQLQLTNALSIIYKSDDFSRIDFNTTTLRATFTDLSMVWDTDLLDYYLAIQPTPLTGADNYPILLPITSRISDTVIQCSDPFGILPTYPSPGYGFADIQWYIKGKPKNEVLNLQNIVIYFTPLTATQKTYQNYQQDAGGNDT